jgi:hypothetical protein
MGAISVNLPFFVSHLNGHCKAIFGVPLFVLVNIRSFARAPAAMRDTPRMHRRCWCALMFCCVFLRVILRIGVVPHAVRN